jgi:DNA-binding response OmpR family regulator
VKKILIVDDSIAELKLIESVLQQAGYWPIAIQDARKLEATLAAERPNLILLDVVMPERNGFQACRELKGSPEFKGIPVVIVTSKNTDSDKFWAKQQGADGYVIKPFTPAELLGAIQRFV